VEENSPFLREPWISDETMTIYMARGLQAGKAQPEADERIATSLVPLSEAKRMALNGRIRDAKTICGILWLAQTGSRAVARATRNLSVIPRVLKTLTTTAAM